MSDASAETQRLQEMYAALGDAELLDLMRGRDGLTSVAQQALDAESDKRHLELPTDVPPKRTAQPVSDNDPSIMRLLTLADPDDVKTVTSALDTAGILYRSDPAAERANEPVAADAVDIFIGIQDQVRAREALRGKLDGLLRDSEDVAPETVEVDGEVNHVLATFSTPEEAHSFRDALFTEGVKAVLSDGVDEEGAYWSVAVLLDDWEEAERAVEKLSPAAAGTTAGDGLQNA